jgi:YaiO family outer membrane protein
MSVFNRILAGAWLAAALLASGRLSAATVAEKARELATHGQRDAAIRLLRDQLAQAPNDTDARTMLGIVLSWEGRYDEARKELETVLDLNPTHADALPAAIRVEIWSGNPYRAERLARRGLEKKPDDPTLLVCRARALDAVGRQEEAESELRRALALDPGNAEARDLSGRIREALVRWQVGLYHTYDHFTPDLAPWNESQLYLKRRTIYGPLIGRWSHAWRFDSQDDQMEIEAYPSIRSGTYAWLDAGYSPSADLYPRYRFGGDIYQSLPAGLEASLGYRRLNFTNTSANIYVGSLGKYYASWLVTGRVFVTPGVAGASRSYSLGARNYFGNGLGYYGFRFGWGRSPEIRSAVELETLRSRTIAGELILPLPRRFEFDLRAGWSHEDRIDLSVPDHVSGVRHLSIGAGLYYSF